MLTSKEVVVERTCIICGKLIPKIRLDLLPSAVTCSGEHSEIWVRDGVETSLKENPSPA